MVCIAPAVGLQNSHTCKRFSATGALLYTMPIRTADAIISYKPSTYFLDTMTVSSTSAPRGTLLWAYCLSPPFVCTMGTSTSALPRWSLWFSGHENENRTRGDETSKILTKKDCGAPHRWEWGKSQRTVTKGRGGKKTEYTCPRTGILRPLTHSEKLGSTQNSRMKQSFPSSLCWFSLVCLGLNDPRK